MKKIVQGTCRVFYGLCFWCLVLCSINFQDISFFLSLPFNFYTIFQAWFLVVMPLRELANFSQSSFLFFLVKLLNSAPAFFQLNEVLLALGFPDYFVELFSFVFFCNWLLHQGLRECFFFISITSIADADEIWTFFYKNLRLERQQILINMIL